MILIMLTISIYCVEVGGHITRSTTWSPENNPYIISTFLYIDSGVTLAILPGTQILCTGADKSDIYNFKWSGSAQPVSKMIIVNGRINAVGTPDLPILFDKYQEDRDFRWGGIYIGPDAQVSTFEYCEFRNSFFCDYVPGDWSLAAIDFDNGAINVKDCVFENNLNAIRTGFLQSDILLYDCKFISMNDAYPIPFGSRTGFIGFSAAPEPAPERNYKVTIAKCYFTGRASLGPVGYYMDVLKLNNVMDNFISRDDPSPELRAEYGSSSSYGNISYNGSKGWGCRSATVTDTVFARRNIMLKPENANPGNSPLILSSNGFGTNYVSDNYLHGYVEAGSMTSNATTNYIYNNIIENKQGNAVLNFENINPANQGGQMRFFNNLVRYVGDFHAPSIANVHDTSPLIYNNTFVNYQALHNDMGESCTTYSNNIIDVSFSLGYPSTGQSELLINNCLSIPIPPGSSIYGEGNIVADPMFADTLNADYSLSAESPCIDAGVNRPDLPAFDIRYHKRISPNGARRVDIGAYEYDSVYIGGINGSVYDAATGAVVDCVKIEIISKLPEFSDTLGCFQYPTGAGVYEVRASRWDYYDRVIRNVTVIEGEDTILNIPLMPLTVSNEDELLPSGNLLPDLKNYPNPFNPETTISFILPEAEFVILSIYNLKGQKVCELYNGILEAGNHNLVWNGIDSKGRAVSSGIYFARIESGKRKQSHKMILMK
jgi:hypothetical protein